MNKQISALIRSLEALDHLMLFTSLKPGFDGRVVDEAYKAINKALAEQPAQRTWVGLTEDDLVDVVPESNTPMSLGEAFVKYGRAIEAKLRSKNENSN